MITDLAFNFYGTRLACATYSHRVRIVRVDKEETVEEGEFAAHEGPVLCVAWGHPEFGSILATGGVDGLVRIWSEDLGAGVDGEGRAKARWREVAVFADGQGTVRGVDFAPPEFGLRVAAVSSDGHVRVWECRAPAALDAWELRSDVDVAQLGEGPSGSEGPSMGGENEVSTSSLENAQGTRGFVESEGAWAVSWFQGPWWGPVLAVSAGRDPGVKLVHVPDHAPANAFLTLQPPPGADRVPVSSVRWAPPTGRSYIGVATGTRAGAAHVFRVYAPELDPGTHAPTPWTAAHDTEIPPESSARAPAKVDWNMSGTVLSVATGSGRVQLWSTTFTGDWKMLMTMSLDE